MQRAHWHASFSRSASRVRRRSGTFALEQNLADLREHHPLLARQARAKRAARLRALQAAADEAERAVVADVNAAT